MSAPQQLIAFAQRKGGVGKTTLAIGVAAELTNRGRQVAMVDADPQRSACAWAELGLLPFAVWEIPLEETGGEHWAEDLKHVETPLVVLDTAPTARGLNAALAVASLVVVPCTPSGLDIEATRQSIAMIGEARQQHRRHIGAILVPNRVDLRTLEGRQFFQELQSFGEAVGPPIGHRVALVRAFTTGQAVGDYARDSMAAREIEQLCSYIELTLR
jgi:chromosome partitioning protein